MNLPLRASRAPSRGHREQSGKAGSAAVTWIDRVVPLGVMD